MTNADSKTEIIDTILKNRELIKSRIHFKQFKEYLTKEEIKKLHKPITDKLDDITEFASLRGLPLNLCNTFLRAKRIQKMF